MVWQNPQHYYISNVTFENFRIINNINFKPAKHLNILAGKNGTAKSTILGMIAQGFSFNPKIIYNISKKDYKTISLKANPSPEEIKKMKMFESIITYNEKNFESRVDEHFKLSTADVKGEKHASITMKANQNNKPSINYLIESNDYADRKNPRLVTRRINNINDNSTDTSSSNIIFPVIYLGLKRVTPIVEEQGLKEKNYGLSESDIEEIFDLYQSILLKKYNSNFTGISNNKNKRTAAFIPKERSIEMISAGEDNIGQILLALYSFKKLKTNYDNYEGGILLIDEIDVTLYPAAQIKLLKILYSKAKEFGIQIFCTTHSLELIEYAMDLKLSSNNRNLIELFNLNIEHHNLGIIPITNINTIKNQFFVAADKEKSSEKIPVYFEDKEAIYVFKGLVTKKKILSYLSIQNNFSLSCTELLKLHKFKIPEFTTKSIVCLDGDNNVPKNIKNYISLPSENNYPPERFIFEILDDNNSDYWNNTKNYSHEIFMNNPHYDIIKRIQRDKYLEDDSPYSIVHSDYYKKKPREVWKMWFKHEQSNWKGCNNPVKFWKSKNNLSVELEKFYNDLKNSIKFVSNKSGIDISDIDQLL